MDDLPERWLRQGAFWRETPFVWTKWERPHENWTHDHCNFCFACICDHRERYPEQKSGHRERGCYPARLLRRTGTGHLLVGVSNVFQAGPGRTGVDQQQRNDARIIGIVFALERSGCARESGFCRNGLFAAGWVVLIWMEARIAAGRCASPSHLDRRIAPKTTTIPSGMHRRLTPMGHNGAFWLRTNARYFCVRLR
jgi:hypothetical protein